jgi:hypothetical protein
MLAYARTAAAAVGLIDRFVGEKFDVDLERLDIRIENSPWVRFAIWVHMRGEFEFALWRSTGDVFAVGEDGAVGDDPVESLEKHLEVVSDGG